MISYNIIMKTELEIEIKKIRKKLRIFGLTEDEKNSLRETLEHLKILRREERSSLVENI